MKALVIQNPWAWCITQAWRDPNAKTVENRSWSTTHRGDVAIIEGRRVDRAALNHPLVRATIDYWLGGASFAPQVWPWETGRGAVVCVVDLYAIGDWAEDDWAITDQTHWKFRDVRALASVVPVRGRQGLFDLPADVEAAVRAQLPEAAS